MTVVKIMALPADLPALFAALPPAQRPGWEAFLTQLALLLTGFLKHKHWAMRPSDLLPALQYLCRISAVPTNPLDELFKICLEFWHLLAARLYLKQKQTPDNGEAPMNLVPITTTSGGEMNVEADEAAGLAGGGAEEAIRTYEPILADVRWVLISRMAKPPEVTIKENEEGEIVRQEDEDTDELALYWSMREALIYLTHLSPESMSALMMGKLSEECLVDGSATWSPTQLNRLCWAIGSISGAHSELDEKRFLVSVIKDLLTLCEMKKGKPNKATVASNIMYVVGQYPRFLKCHWKFLRTVVFKLFEFMHETFPGVQEMAVDTFLKICQKCRRKFVVHQVGEMQPFVQEIMGMVKGDTQDLELLQQCTYFEAVGYMISAAKPEGQPLLVASLLTAQTHRWKEILAAAAQQPDILYTGEVLREISQILRLHERVTQAVGAGVSQQLSCIYIEMLKVYQAYSEYISQASAQQGPGAMGLEHVRLMRRVKRDALRLVSAIIAFESTVETFVPPLLEPVLNDYRSNIPQAREAEVLLLLKNICANAPSAMASEVHNVLEIVFASTLDMIKADFTSFPDHRKNFYELLRQVNKSCYPSLLKLRPEILQMYVDSLVWAMKHDHPNIADVGLSTLGKFTETCLKFESPDVVARSFCSQYYFALLRDVLSVLTDTMHKAGFSGQVHLLLVLTQALPKVEQLGVSTKQAVSDYVVNLLCQSFQTVQRAQVEYFVTELFLKSQAFGFSDYSEFPVLVRDFLISIKEFTAADFADANAGAIAQTRAEARRRIPGLIPDGDTSALPDAMDDL